MIEQVVSSSLEKGKSLGFKTGKASGVVFGSRLCHSHLLMTPYGQAFLDELVNKLPQAYLHYMAMDDTLITWVVNIIESCCSQLKIEGRVSEIDLDIIMDILKKSIPSKGAESQANDRDNWFMECLTTAAKALSKPEEYEGAISKWGELCYGIFPQEAGEHELLKCIFDMVCCIC